MRDSQKLLRTIRSKRRRSRAVACCRRGRWHTIGVAEREVINIKFSLSLPQSFFVLQKMTAIAPLRCPDFVYAAWSAAQNRPLRQQMLPLSATGGGRICCPSEGAYIIEWKKY